MFNILYVCYFQTTVENVLNRSFIRYVQMLRNMCGSFGLHYAKNVKLSVQPCFVRYVLLLSLISSATVHLDTGLFIVYFLSDFRLLYKEAIEILSKTNGNFEFPIKVRVGKTGQIEPNELIHL